MLRLNSNHAARLKELDDSSSMSPKVEKDQVILHQFPRSPFVPNLSPYCLKVETFLRLYNIKYQLRESWTKQVDGNQLPYIELNGRRISDAQTILFRLVDHFKIKENMRPFEAAVARAVDRMLDGSTFYVLMNDKVLNNAAFMSREVTGLRVPAVLGKFVASRFANKVRAKIVAGVGSLSNEDMMEVMRRDVAALADILGEKQFLLGSRMTSVDCGVFGHLACTYYLPFPQHVQDLLDKKHPNLRDYIERIRSTIYSDIPRPERFDLIKSGMTMAVEEPRKSTKKTGKAPPQLDINDL